MEEERKGIQQQRGYGSLKNVLGCNFEGMYPRVWWGFVMAYFIDRKLKKKKKIFKKIKKSDLSPSYETPKCI